MTLSSSRRFSGPSSSSRFLLSSVLALGLGLSASAMAQVTVPVPANVVNIAASGFLEVPQDWLSMSLNTTREGSDAVTVQNQLKQALDAALAVARANAKPQQLEVRTGQFSLYPRYSSNGKINGWQGSTELVLEGRDFALISATAGKIQTLTMSAPASRSRATHAASSSPMCRRWPLSASRPGPMKSARASVSPATACAKSM